MAEKKPKPVMYITPVGVASYPYLTKPDTKYYAQGEYKTGFVLTGKDAQAMKKQVDDEIAKSVAAASIEKGEEVAAGAKPYKVLIDKETGKPSGDIKFNFKQKAVIITKKGEWHKKILLMDTKNQVLPPTMNIGSGSEIRIAYNIVPWASPLGASVSLRPVQVQLHKFVEFTGGGDPDEAAFDTSDGGFVAESFEFGTAPTEMDDTDRQMAKSANGDF